MLAVIFDKLSVDTISFYDIVKFCMQARGWGLLFDPPTQQRLLSHQRLHNNKRHKTCPLFFLQERKSYLKIKLCWMFSWTVSLQSRQRQSKFTSNPSQPLLWRSRKNRRRFLHPIMRPNSPLPVHDTEGLQSAPAHAFQKWRHSHYRLPSRSWVWFGQTCHQVAEGDLRVVLLKSSTYHAFEIQSRIREGQVDGTIDALTEMLFLPWKDKRKLMNKKFFIRKVGWIRS